MLGSGTVSGTCWYHWYQLFLGIFISLKIFTQFFFDFILFLTLLGNIEGCVSMSILRKLECLLSEIPIKTFLPTINSKEIEKYVVNFSVLNNYFSQKKEWSSYFLERKKYETFISLLRDIKLFLRWVIRPWKRYSYSYSIFPNFPNTSQIEFRSNFLVRPWFLYEKLPTKDSDIESIGNLCSNFSFIITQSGQYLKTRSSKDE